MNRKSRILKMLTKTGLVVLAIVFLLSGSLSSDRVIYGAE